MNSLPAVLIAENSHIQLPQNLETTVIKFSKGVFDDITIHDFLLEHVLPHNPTALIIPASLGSIQTDYWGFRIAMHIRLTKKLGSILYIPLILVSDDSLEEIMVAQAEKLSILCTTPGSILVKNDEDEIEKALSLSALSQSEYRYQFLRAIMINRPTTTGKHSLANVWGVSRLAKVTGLEKYLLDNKYIADRYKELYFKYLQAINDSLVSQEGAAEIPELAPINAENKKILLIDDEADKGWIDVLKPLFKGNLEYVGTGNKSFDEFYAEAQKAVDQPIWDLILLDLRLDPQEDLEGNEYKMASEYSGAKLLAHIKTVNAGNQIIIFTASNKAWNMQQLLDMNADGYYVKESPETGQSATFSVLTFNNFAQRANLCLEKSYLREAWMICVSVKKLLTPVNLTTIRAPNTIILHLDQGFNSMYQANAKKAEFYLYAFLDFYRIIEVLGKDLVRENAKTGYIIMSSRRTGSKVIPFIKFSPLECEIKPTTINEKPSSYSLNKYTPNKDDTQYYEKPTSSLLFCGLMLLRFNMTQADTSRFLRLNKLRNDLTHEGAAKVSITYQDVMEILHLIKRVFGEF
jgi:CheY-like chemotaxis protein